MSEWTGFGIFDALAEETARITDDAVQAAELSYAVHPLLSFPGQPAAGANR